LKTLYEQYLGLTLFEKVGIWGSIASLIGLIPMILALLRRVLIGSPKKALREFWFVFNYWAHFVLTTIIVFSLIYFLALPGPDFLAKASVLISESAFLLLCISFFLRQNKPVMRQFILAHIARIIKTHGNVCSAIKYDIDLIVAVNDFSYAVGGEIVALVYSTLREHEKRHKKRGIDVLSVEIPESDEVIWILPNVASQQAADFADDVRREVKRNLKKIAYYDEVCAFVSKKLTNPPLTSEEREGIGTVSAGVAAFTRGVESLLSDISSACKESKFRGRNRTIIYQREEPSIIRDH
jgi:GGDEF domain-containing protein